MWCTAGHDAMSVISQTADQLMFLFPCVFAWPSSTVHEKAMLAIVKLLMAFVKQAYRIRKNTKYAPFLYG